MEKPTDLPPDLVTILRECQKQKKFGMLYVAFLEDGSVQAMTQRRGEGPDTYGGVEKDVLAAILKAVGPNGDQTWAEYLGYKPTVRKASVPHVKPKRAPVVDDDDFDVV